MLASLSLQTFDPRLQLLFRLAQRSNFARQRRGRLQIRVQALQLALQLLNPLLREGFVGLILTNSMRSHLHQRVHRGFPVLRGGGRVRHRVLQLLHAVCHALIPFLLRLGLQNHPFHRIHQLRTLSIHSILTRFPRFPRFPLDNFTCCR